ncbi:cation diffusion facilitator family transporter [Roseomonas sp. GC11]|uniref:cation diffusion facilitator family transporter n=1 Tax=Roseomonas sp. GC11 TaxID=2950546 RepID=UPI00210D21D4|nr:cation transporter [Roseomonas sp. GC11]MCQ4161311.1 cation diffusion facilitator family transporter [Roseomonas sp. GC11]
MAAPTSAVPDSAVPDSAAPDSAALARERSLLFGTLADIAMLFAYVAVGVWSGSLTLLAEALRGGLLILLELVVYALMRRIHRGRMAAYDYGSGKLEQFANLVVGLAMAGGAVWLAVKALGRLEAAGAAPAGSLWVAAGLAVVNLGVNAAAAWAMWLAGRDGASVIMTGQIRTRLSKLLSSAVVVGAIALSAWAPGSLASRMADLGGTLFVALVMLGVAARLWRDSLPDLLDRSLDEERQALINRALAARFEDYESLLAVRTRQSGHRVQVEIALGFDPAQPFARIAGVMAAVEAEVAALIPGAEVLVLPRPAGG